MKQSKQIVIAGIVLAACAGVTASAQDWYHDRLARYEGHQGHAQVFAQINADLDHIGSLNASAKENARLQRTKEELTRMQSDLDQGRFDNGMTNDVTDSLKKSSEDQRLSMQDRAVLQEDLEKLHDYQKNHDHWKQ